MISTVLTGDDAQNVDVIRSQDVGPILEQSKQEYANSTSNWKGDFHKVAEIPLLVVENFCTRNKITFAEFCKEKKYLKLMLNDPALKYFRTKGGRI